MRENINEGDHVVLMKSFDSDNVKIVAAQKDSIIHYGKLHFDPSPLIGAKFGSVFEIKDKTMIEVKDFESFNEDLSSNVSSSSSTFNEKSQFSKEKLIKKRKKQNHSNVLTVIRPSILLVNEMLYARDKLGGLRWDFLAQILTLSNVQNGSKCLLLDHNLGMLTGAIMSRILPDGVCIQLLPDIEAISTTRKTLDMLNLNEQIYKDKLLGITVRDLFKVHTGINTFNYENEILKARIEEHRARLTELNSDQQCIRNLETGEKTMEIQEQNELQENLLKKDLNREQRHQERAKAISYLNTKSLDSLVIVSQHDHPLPILKMCIEFLAYSRPFVIFNDQLDPLLECYQYLKSNSLAVSLNLSESWLRKYQVLPDRTRPEMNASGYGGYLLSGIKVQI